jgi:hypothetical protein
VHLGSNGPPPVVYDAGYRRHDPHYDRDARRYDRNYNPRDDHHDNH